MAETEFNSLEAFVEACRDLGQYRAVRGADWDLEIGAIVETAAELRGEPPLLLFDEIIGHEPGFRVASLVLTTYERTALAMGLPLDRPRLELTRLAAAKIREAVATPPGYVASGPVFDNVLEGDSVDLLRFPAPRFHEGDGGRYIGTGAVLLNRDPDSDFVNAGTYRMQVHEHDVLGLWQSPGQQGRLICERYWRRGLSCPVVATFGQDPLTFIASCIKLPWGHSELSLAGGLRGRPVEVVEGPLTGLPIPAHAEIAVEGEIPPPAIEARAEGPFGEWPGYYSGGTIGTGEKQPIIRVKAVYYRQDPILWDEAPMWTGAPRRQMRIDAGILWHQLESAGIDGIAGVHQFNPYLVVVAISQRYAGHARQTAHAVLGCAAAARNGRYVVVVDEDIDPTNLQEVLWSMETRVDPGSDIEIVQDCWSTPLDPRMPPAKRRSLDHTNSRALIYAVRPFPWKAEFPTVSRVSPTMRQHVLRKYSDLLDPQH